MKIRRERPSQRLHHRVSAPLRVEICETIYEVEDWSLGGFHITGFDPAISDVPILAISGKSEESDITACKEAGMECLIPKPLTKQKLTAAINAAAKAAGKEKMRVLLADDDPLIRETASAMLTSNGWEAVTVEDGAEAIDVFSPSKFDCVLMDIMMPNVGGLEAAKTIKQTFATEIGSEFVCTVYIPFQGFGISFELNAEVVRCEDGELATRFIDVPNRENEIMRHFIDEIVRGSITTVADTLMRIDTPVTPVSTEPDTNPAEDVPLYRRSWRQIAWTSAYLTIGLGLLFYSGTLIYANFYRLEINTAVVSAPIEPVLASTDGRIKSINSKPGQMVKRDTPLIIIENARLEQEISLAKIQVSRSMMTLLTKRRELAAEKARFSENRRLAFSQIDQINERLKSLERRTLLAGRQKQRVATLLSEGWATKSTYDKIDSDYTRLTGELEETRLLMQERRAVIDGLEQNNSFSGSTIEGNIPELKAAFELAMDEVTLTKDALSALQARRNRLTLYATSRGNIVRQNRFLGANIKKGEQIALFERDEARVIEAFLTQDEVLEIGLGDQASVYFPSLDKSVTAVITEIDRTSGFLDEANARYKWRGDKDRSARVQLHFLDLSITEVRRIFSPGLPAVVLFKRRDTNITNHQIRNHANDLFTDNWSKQSKQGA